MPDFALEAAAGGRVAGVDEAGRGPLAGPVLAGAVVFAGPPEPALAALLDDSKRLKPAQREAAFAALRAAARSGTARVGWGAATAAEIGALNILRATHLAMLRAVRRLGVPPDLALVDGNQQPRAPHALPCAVRCVVGGDRVSLSIAAASIVAKVLRDRAMVRWDARFPGYGFAMHAGYPTPAHREALGRLGPTPQHRRGFAPVEQAVLRAQQGSRAAPPGNPPAAPGPARDGSA
ncbi:ribonuclease HII [Roseomonas sp. BN140053]|uniref:ribonuclease HII n=1 Tax=Roseomonas sp. BN140053 TaxID=3391898 RepID=UPI0039E7BFE1